MRTASSILAAAALALGPALTAPAVAASPPTAAAAAPAECAPTALAIRGMTDQEVWLEFLPLGPRHEWVEVEGLAGELQDLLPALSLDTARDFSRQLQAGDGGTYSLECAWSDLGAPVRETASVGLRVAHPLISADGREALLMIQRSGDETVRTCYLRGGPTAWVVAACDDKGL